jgi:hypothetical protein
MPSAQATRAALTHDDENTVGAVSLLLFENQNGKMIFRRQVDAVPTMSAPGSGQADFSARIPQGVYDIVVLANAADILAAINVTPGYEKAAVIDSLVGRMPGKWNRNRIPAWGQRDNVTVDGQHNLTGNNAVAMTRMMAKIDLGMSASAANDFRLSSVRLYNYSTQGTIIPNAANAAANLPTAPVSGYAKVVYPAAPLVYDTNDGVTPDSCKRIIYTYESDAVQGQQGQLMNTCIIAGGSYKNNPVSYYRIDFTEQVNGQEQYIPILRNHCYNFRIKDVLANGLPTPEEAFEAGPTNMECNMLAWDESYVDDISFDDQYILSVSRRSISLEDSVYKTNTDENRLTIMTTCPTGWEIDSITDATGAPAGWISLSDSASSIIGQQNDTYLYVRNNLTTAPRDAYMHIRAGNLTCKVEVKQDKYVNNHSNPLKFTVLPAYTMDGREREFFIEGDRPWEIIGITDLAGIITNATALSTKQGGAWTNFNDTIKFNIINDLTRKQIVDTIASILVRDGMGQTYNVNIHGQIPYEFTSRASGFTIDIYPEDQPDGYTWYQYANVKDGDNTAVKPPQVSPAREHSCAALDPQNPSYWQMPSKEQMGRILNVAQATGMFTKYNLNTDVYYPELWTANVQRNAYWSFTTYTANGTTVPYSAFVVAYCLPRQDDDQRFGVHKGSIQRQGGYNLHVRCVHVKPYKP